MTVLVGTFNQEKALVGAFSVITNLHVDLRFKLYNRLFLYNTCLVLCGLTMAASNYFQPAAAALAGVECPGLAAAAVTNSTSAPQYDSWVCDPYYGQFLYVNCYGVTRYY